MDVLIEPLVSSDQPIVINSEETCLEFSKCEDIVSLDDRDDKSDTNSSSSIIAEENGTGKQYFYIIFHNFTNFILIK